MFSFLMGVMTAIQAGKKKMAEKSRVLKEKRVNIQKHMNGEVVEDSSNKVTKPDEKRTAKVKFMAILTLVVMFFEMLPAFFSLMTWGLIILCLLILIVIIFALMAVIAALKEEEEEALVEFKPDEVSEVGEACGPTGGTLAWTDTELASRGLKLNDYEKNLYRLGIFARKAVEGYGGTPLMTVDNGTPAMRTLSLMGVFSVENSMIFYDGGKNPDITKTPSNKRWNSAGYGIMGLNHQRNVEFYIKDKAVISKLKGEYKPDSTPSHEAAYLPYAMVMSAKHQQTDFSTYMTRQKTKDTIAKIASDWGIKANVKEFTALTQIFLGQSHYHGAYVKDYEAYVNFFAALFVATSENDAERTFDKWSIKISDKTSDNKFDESSIRESYLGAAGKNGMRGQPSSLQTNGSSTKILLNGKELTVPVWKYVGEKFSDRAGFKTSWSTVTSMSANGSDMVLNFHYGFNSYLQAKRVEQVLAKKMSVAGQSASQDNCSSVAAIPGKFKATPGKAQGIVNGKSTEAYLEDYYKKKGNTSKVVYLKNLQKHFGTANYLSNPNNPALKGGYKDAKFGVPFYGQGGKYGETYLYENYVPGGNTFLISACMIYTYSYAASAMTGTLINPAEMGAILHVNDAFLGNLIYTRKVPSILKQMGLNAETIENGTSWNNFDSTLEKGGVVVIRTRPGQEGFTRSQHFQVLTGKEQKNGKTYYSMYTSSYHTQSMVLYTKEQIVRNMHRDAMIVWK